RRLDTANNSAGILVSGADGNTIGGSTAAARNVISGNSTAIQISGNNNVVQGNFVGVDVTGSVPVGNNVGIEISGSGTAGTTIGGTTAGARNIIAANGTGIQLFSSTNTTVQGNY